MKKYLTEYKDIDRRRFAGPIILALTWEDAEALCELIMPHVYVVGELVETISNA